MPRKTDKRAIVYTRVSRVGDRSGESYVSPDVQREACEAKAKLAGYDVIEIIHEEDVSGGDADRKGYVRAIEMIETGRAEAIVIWDIWRFSRSVSDGARDIDRITKAGGDLLSTKNDIGDNTATGRFQRNVFLAMGQMYREQAAEGFALYQARAISHGIFTASKIPFGYVKNPETRKLEVVPEEAGVIKAIFEMRAKGESWSALAKYVIANGGSPKTAHRAVAWMIANVAYLGHSRNGDNLKKNAHEAIVSQRLYEAANAVKGQTPKHNGRLTSQTLLNGLVYCDSCGRTMKVNNSHGKTGFNCRTLTCSEKAGAMAYQLDAEVIDRLRAFWATYRFAAREITPGNEAELDADLRAAREALADAEHLISKFESNRREYLKAMEPAEFAAELRSLKVDVEETRIAVEMAESAMVDPGRQENLVELWETWTDDSRREFLARTLSKVIVRKAPTGVRVPIAERVAVGTVDGLWLHPKAGWSSEAFAEPRSPLHLVSRRRAKKAAAHRHATPR